MTRLAIVVLICMEAALPRAASSQNTLPLSHADSVLAKAIVTLVQPLEAGQIIVTGDTAFWPLLAVVDRPVGICLPMLHLERLSAMISGDASHPKLDIEITGSLLRPGVISSRQQVLRGTFDLTLTKAEWESIESNSDPYVHLREESSLFSRTLAPALVILGAAAIVALFFLVRG